MAKDPVCGMEIKAGEAKASSEYKGKTYQFCHESCKATFDKSPEKYAKAGCCSSGRLSETIPRSARSEAGERHREGPRQVRESALT
jgi:Cu+-exporting ATPase